MSALAPGSRETKSVKIITSLLRLFRFSLAHLLVSKLAPGSREMESAKKISALHLFRFSLANLLVSGLVPGSRQSLPAHSAPSQRTRSLPLSLISDPETY